MDSDEHFCILIFSIFTLCLPWGWALKVLNSYQWFTYFIYVTCRDKKIYYKHFHYIYISVKKSFKSFSFLLLVTLIVADFTAVIAFAAIVWLLKKKNPNKEVFIVFLLGCILMCCTWGIYNCLLLSYSLVRQGEFVYIRQLEYRPRMTTWI